MTVTLVEKYNPEWPKWFEEIKTFLGEKIAKACIRIEHVGSTAIPGMIAKPIIELTLVIKSARFAEIKSLLEERGYCYEGDKGIKDREAFDLVDEKIKKSLPKHHLYVCPEQSEALKRHVLFRNYLRKNKKDAKRLSDLKWTLAEKFNNDKYPYMDGKAALCEEITKKAQEQSRKY